MITVELTEQELEIAHQGLSAFLHDFGHDEADTIERIRAVLDKLDAARPVDTTGSVLS